MYFIRLDDASEKMDLGKWDRIEGLLDKYSIKPLIGVIPYCEDPDFNKYSINEHFWERVISWQNKGYCIALHGYNHVYNTSDAGINPIHNRSEFAGLPYDEQKKRILNGIEILHHHNINPCVFFAPSHTFDLNTLKVLKNETQIRIVSDTIAYDVYCSNGITFIPQQTGRARLLPFKVVTFCYHPNTMKDKDFVILEKFLKKHKIDDFAIKETNREYNQIDKLLNSLYFVKQFIVKKIFKK